jgi:hypothetical protein
MWQSCNHINGVQSFVDIGPQAAIIGTTRNFSLAKRFIKLCTYRLVWFPGQNKRMALLSFFRGCRKRRIKEIASAPEIDCNHTAMGLPPATSAVFLIAKSFW